MCLLTFAIDADPEHPFVFTGNRDEFHERPTAAAHWWDDAPDVFGGRDLKEGGAWLGLRVDGRFAVVTNFRAPGLQRDAARSRGELVRDFLAGKSDVEHMHRYLQEHGDGYSGFNLLYGELKPGDIRLHFFSNAMDSASPERVATGIHGLSNHLLDTPWPKVERSRERLGAMITSGDIDHHHLQSILDDPEPATDAMLPDTGVGQELERLLSAPKIISPRYGTRATTSIVMDREGCFSFRETSFDPQGREIDRVALVMDA